MPEVYAILAPPRRVPKPLPSWPNPGPRPEGDLQPLNLNYFSDVPRAVDVALDRIPKQNAAAFVQEIQSAGNRSVQIKIDSAGGDTVAALQIAVALLEHPFHVRCYISGRCSSSAAFVALAADTRTISAGGSVLLHGAKFVCTPEQYREMCRLSSDERSEAEDWLNDFNDAQVALLEQRLGVTEETARLWLDEEKKWTAEEALANNFVHAIDVDATPPNAETADGN